MSDMPFLDNDIIYQEMMSHPVLYSHLNPEVIGIIGDSENKILHEVLKHPTVKTVWQINKNEVLEYNTGEKVKNHKTKNWIKLAGEDFFDILIVAEDANDKQFSSYLNTLKLDGLLLQISGSPFQVNDLKTLKNNLFSTGFKDALTLSFPQPRFSSGWRAAIIAKKHAAVRKIREKDIFNKTFDTHYYNLDAHKAALAQPEFMRKELAV